MIRKTKTRAKNGESGKRRGKIIMQEGNCHITAVIGEWEPLLIGVAMAMVGTSCMCVPQCMIVFVCTGCRVHECVSEHLELCVSVCVCACLHVCRGGLNVGSCWGIISVVKGK